MRMESIRTRSRPGLAALGATASLLAAVSPMLAAPTVSRLTPPSALFSYRDPDPPIIARLLPGQRFDLQATVSSDAGQAISGIEFRVDGRTVPGTVSAVPATVAGKPPGTVVASLRAYSSKQHGVHPFTVNAWQSDGQTVTTNGNFEIRRIQSTPANAKSIITLSGDGMGRSVSR